MSALAAVFLIAAPAAPEEIVLLDFTASYCGPCRSIKPQIDQLIRAGYPIRPVDLTNNPQLARRFNVKSIPTFVLLVNGRERKRLTSAQAVTQLKPLLDTARRELAATRQSAPRKEQPQKSEAGQPSLLERVFAKRRRVEPEELELVLAQEPDKKPDAPAPKANPNPTSASKAAMASSVRIRVTYNGKVQFGSGTIIHSRKGRTIILTCAHIMDQAGDNPKVQVDVYSGPRKQTFVGTIIGHDIKPDVGIISIPTSSRLPVVPVAVPSLKLKKLQRVFSIGCNNGKDPTHESAQLSGIDRYIGPNNLETNHAPEHGRSGGGLFDQKGRLIGVCSAADRKGNHGLYAGHRAIYDMLKKHKLLAVYGNELAKGKSGRRTALADNVPATGELQSMVMQGLDDAPMFDDAPSFDDTGNNNAPPFGDASPFDPNSVASTLKGGGAQPRADIPDDIHVIDPRESAPTVRDKIEALGGAAEVTVVIRPRDPRKLSQIVVIPRASSNFVSMLQGELDDQPQPTSYVRPETPQPATTARLNREARFSQRDTLFVVPMRTIQRRGSDRRLPASSPHRAASDTPKAPERKIPLRKVTQARSGASHQSTTNQRGTAAGWQPQ